MTGRVETPGHDHPSAEQGHAHGHGQAHGHRHSHRHGGHSHGPIDPSILRSRAGVRAVLLSLGVLGLTAAVQALVFVFTGSVALLADLIHNAGDALTAIPVGIAFWLRSWRAERWAGYAVVGAIFVSACVAGYESVRRLLDPQDLDHLLALALAGLAGFAGNQAAAWIRLRAGRRLDSAALVADGEHARADALVSLGVVASAAVVAMGVEVADPLIGLAITALILRITWSSLRTVREDMRLERTSEGIVIHNAAHYDRRMTVRTEGREEDFREEVADLAALAPGDRVLDVGCGTGSLALVAAARVRPGGHVHGVDPSPEMVERARRKARERGVQAEFSTGLAQQLPLPQASVDVVLASLVLHQVPADRLESAFAEIRRVLRPGGRFLVVEIDPGAGDGGPTPHSHGRFDLDALLARLPASGFRQLDSGPMKFRIAAFEPMRYALFA